MLATREEIKELLGISNSNNDELISASLVALEDWLPDYLNNYFTSPNLYIEASTISFSGDVISDSDSGFLDEGFTPEMDIYVFGSQHNDGFYIIKKAEAGALTTYDGDFVEEAAGTVAPKIQMVKFPKGLKPAVANLINHQIHNSGAKSEKIGDYSVTYQDKFPESILTALAPYKKVVF